ncbi:MULTISPECIES: SDR family oxidoreductase [Actibacterium]|uniref:NAD(P)-dependent dehydrogenase (Short-subunit alcohol dehydrogenase family) n=1 Tax=Actibacterium naphthalenivorans TaxID=1614693 RepID=A0A840CCA0_9RHOB|nr:MULTISPECIES: SDR family oxidoreductase [Actibacterium]ALG91664.1 3-oxoacyl-ACP reductase [Actibacterium sp. EMB200-NS6]MBB4021692.1 NAD(P)-dependent dehydrogenase (short-subunit alcohol dehydrogenase family) [Actibacterium naphthalenivorans]
MIDPAQMFSINGRVALVTGASSGIGRMIATGLAACGARVYACARTAARLEEAVAEIRQETSGDVIALPGDVSTVAGIEALVAELSNHEKQVDILVNNAGTICEAPIDEYPEDGWDSVLSLNLKSCFFLTQKLLPLMRAGATGERPSTVINIGSVGALRIGPKETYAYAAAKAGLHHLSKSMAKRLAPENITINSIAPGFFPSDMTQITSDEMHDMLIQMVPRRRVGQPLDLAGLAVFLASPAASYMTGTVIPVEGGMSL